MAATDEELDAVQEMKMDHVTYVLGMYRCVVFPFLVHLRVTSLPLFKYCIPNISLYDLPHQPLHDLGEKYRHVKTHGCRLLCLSKWGDRVDEPERRIQVVRACAGGGRCDTRAGRGRIASARGGCCVHERFVACISLSCAGYWIDWSIVELMLLYLHDQTAWLVCTPHEWP